MSVPVKFWMVWGENAGLPTKRHSGFEEASEEAKRLALKHPNGKFYVLEALNWISGSVSLVGGDLSETES